MSSTNDWRSEYRAATEAPHPAVKERVWRGLEQRPRRSTARVAVFALAGCCAAVAVAVVLVPRGESRAQTGDGFAWVSSDARLEQDGATLTLRSGRVVVSAWQTPVTVKAGRQQVVVDAAIASVEVAGDQTSVRALEGVVLVDGERVASRPAEPALTAELDRVRALESPEAPVLRAEVEAERATVEQRWDDASRSLSVVATSSSLRAESALLKRGELELRQLKQPARALASFDEGDARFPSGSLAPERALSALEASVAQTNWPDAVTRADRFLERFPANERADEVRGVKAAALHAQGRTGEACALAKKLPTLPAFAANCPK